MILLAVDVQKGIIDDELYACETFLDRVVRLIDAARKNNVEVIYVQHDDGHGSGFSAGDEDFEIADQAAPLKGEKVFTKTVCSSFSNKELAAYLEQQEDKRLMIVGLQTDFCIDATVKSAFERGFKVLIPEGTNSTFGNDYMSGETAVRYYNEFVWPGSFAECIPFEEAINIIEQ